jgi:hypothetical protein
MAMSTMIGLTVAVGASPAGAAAPQRETFTYSDEFCYQDEGSSSSPTYCYRYTDTYTYKVIGTFAGKNYLFQSTYTSTFTETRDGVVGYTGTSRGSSMFKAREGVEQISRYTSRGSDSGPFGSCTYLSRFIYVNGAIKVDRFDFRCDTPTL